MRKKEKILLHIPWDRLTPDIYAIKQKTPFSPTVGFGLVGKDPVSCSGINIPGKL